MLPMMIDDQAKMHREELLQAAANERLANEVRESAPIARIETTDSAARRWLRRLGEQARGRTQTARQAARAQA